MIQQHGVPREQHLGDVWQKKVWVTKSFIKDENTGWVDIYGAFLRPTSSGF